MKSLRTIAMAATAMLALSCYSAKAAETVGQVGWWKISYLSDFAAGVCISSTVYQKSNILLEIFTGYDTNETHDVIWGISIHNDAWKGNTKNLNALFEMVKDGKVFNGWTVSNMPPLKNGGWFSGVKSEVINNLADATNIVITDKDTKKVLGNLSLTDSTKAIKAAIECRKNHTPVVQATRTSPTDKKEKKGDVITGTGFFVRPGFIITNMHVVAKCDGAPIAKYPGFKGEVAYFKAGDDQNDLALLTTKLVSDGIAKLRTKLKLGEFGASYGFPYGTLTPTFTTGNITAITGPKNDSTMFQFSAPVQPGNSGGPLMDSMGRVLGVTNAIMTTLAAAEHLNGAVPQNVNYAVSSATVINFLSLHDIEAVEEPNATKLDPEEIAAQAKKFTVQLTCNAKS
jgi:S1-C subfamily serine protease